jgi:hypothetical protein
MTLQHFRWEFLKNVSWLLLTILFLQVDRTSFEGIIVLFKYVRKDKSCHFDRELLHPNSVFYCVRLIAKAL